MWWDKVGFGGTKLAVVGLQRTVIVSDAQVSATGALVTGRTKYKKKKSWDEAGNGPSIYKRWAVFVSEKRGKSSGLALAKNKRKYLKKTARTFLPSYLTHSQAALFFFLICPKVKT